MRRDHKNRKEEIDGGTRIGAMAREIDEVWNVTIVTSVVTSRMIALKRITEKIQAAEEIVMREEQDSARVRGDIARTARSAMRTQVEKVLAE